MRILERYINTRIIVIFLSTVFIFCFLHILIDITTQLDEFIDRKVPVKIIIQYYISYTPIILVRITPVACLISVLFTFSAMSNTNEVIVMRASGLNFWQITKPALIFGLLVSVLVFWLNESYVPKATQTTREIKNENMILLVDRLRKKKEIKNLTFYGLKNRLYFIDTYNPTNYELTGITIIEHGNDQEISQKVVAYKGKWTGIAWKFFNTQITEYGEAGIKSPIKVKVYDEKLMDIKEEPNDFLRQRLNVATMNIKQLRNYISRFSNSGAVKALNNLKVDLHQKYADPFGNFVIVFLGLPFALLIRSRKGGTFSSIFIAIVICLLYFVINAVMLAFGKGGGIPPLLAAWAAPIIFIGISLVIIEKNFG